MCNDYCFIVHGSLLAYRWIKMFIGCIISFVYSSSNLKPWSQRPTGLNSTQLVELSLIGRCDHNPRLISTQLIQLSQVLRFWTVAVSPEWSRRPMRCDHSLKLNSTQLPVELSWVRSGAVIRALVFLCYFPVCLPLCLSDSLYFILPSWWNKRMYIV